MQPKSTSRPASPANATPASPTITNMREAIGKTVAMGPAFLRGDIDADHMAHTMVEAVDHCVASERAAGRTAPSDASAQTLQQVLGELRACGSGYLAGRCDAACVGRTMTYIVGQFGTH